MKKLDFNPSKSKSDFRKNYKLHDVAEFHGKNLLTQWGFKCTEFGKDKRYERVWEKGEDKPDLIISYKDKSALLDWKGKRGSTWLVNERAISSYEKWREEFKLTMIVAFFVIDDERNILKKRFAVINQHNYSRSRSKQWDKNVTIEFQKDLPEFTKANILKYLL